MASVEGFEIHPADAVMLKIDRAETHFQALGERVNWFMQNHGARFRTEPDYKGRATVRVDHVEEPCREISTATPPSGARIYRSACCSSASKASWS